MDFYSRIGPVALGSRLRRLADRITAESEDIYALYETDLDPRWFPVFFMLQEKGSASVSELAADIGQTHAAVSQIVAAMIKAGVATREKSPDDARVTLVSLTAAGSNKGQKLALQCRDMGVVMEAMLPSGGRALWAELDALEYRLDEETLSSRIGRVRKVREAQTIRISAFSDEHQQAFRDLNVAWIGEHFTMEEPDRAVLNDPRTHILAPGGYIAIAELGDRVVGTCALKPGAEEGTLELVKMAVDPSVQGRGIGYLLGQHILDKAKDLGAGRVVLETNSKLQAAISLYHKLGFEPYHGGASEFSRCNTQMMRVFA